MISIDDPVVSSLAKLCQDCMGEFLLSKWHDKRCPQSKQHEQWKLGLARTWVEFARRIVEFKLGKDVLQWQ